jgi:hypothetical protein
MNLMGKINNGWTLERRKAQSEKIKQWKPWEKSTGARTLKGKSISSRNADKGKAANWLAVRTEVRAIKKIMRMQAEMLAVL